MVALPRSEPGSSPSLNGSDVVLNGDFYHIDQEYQGFALLPAYTVSDFFVEWKQVANLPVDLTAFVDNAFNRLYVNNVSVDAPGIGVYSGSYAPPRLFGLRARYRFGGG
jgi:iron complex outermembrane receptor protein